MLFRSELFGRVTNAVLSLTGRSYWVEKTPHHMMHLDRIRRWIPGSRFVVMLREPRAFLQSYKQQGDRKAPSVRREFHRLYHPAAASTVAKRTYLAAAREADHEDVLLVPLESVQREPDVWMPRIRRHLRLPESDRSDFDQDNSSFAGGEVTTRPLCPTELAWLRRIAGPAAAGAGYDVEDLPTAPLSLALSAAMLPWWAISNARTLSRLDRGGLPSLVRRWLG